MSFLVALDLAATLVEAGQHEAILVSSAELSSRSLDFDEPESATLLGDGAAAAVEAHLGWRCARRRRGRRHRDVGNVLLEKRDDCVITAFLCYF